MTELLPGPEDPGKHLFEISPGRLEHPSVLCWGWPWWPQWQCHCTSGLGRATSATLLSVRTPALSPSTIRKFGPNLEDITHLGGI